jgi:hypothetical protein
MDLQAFVITATENWTANEEIRRFSLPNNESVACIVWNGRFFITGTDIVKLVAYQFVSLSGRPLADLKKFEEGIFSDLRNLKPGVHSVLEEARSPFLNHLFINGCTRTQKKQKVFLIEYVDFDKLVADSVEREQRRSSVSSMDAASEMQSMSRSMSLDSGLMLSTAPSTEFQPDLYGFNEEPQYGQIQLDSLIKINMNDESPQKDFGSHDSNLSASFSFPSFPGAVQSYTSQRRRSSIGQRAIPYIKSENTNRQYACTFNGCDKAFKRYEHLKRHFLIHSGEKPFQCPQHGCGRMFSRSDNLNQHMKIHEVTEQQQPMPATKQLSQSEGLYYQTMGAFPYEEKHQEHMPANILHVVENPLDF